MDKPFPIPPKTPENITLVDSVRPPDWTNPEPAPVYNLLVIGAGTAGLVCAAGAASLGARVALVEKHLLGGDCLNYGCVPSKGIIRSARAVHDAQRGEDFGFAPTEKASADFRATMERMRRLRASLSPHDSARRFRDELGVDVFFGEGRFTGSDTLDVSGKQLRFRRAAICTGARAATPPFPGILEAGYLTNETVFSLTDLPPRLAVIGSGPIGSEMAQTFRRLGSEVFLFERGEQILPREERDAAEIVMNSFLRDGVEVFLGTGIAGVQARNGGKAITAERGGTRFELVVDEILVGVGRAPNLEGLDLEAAQIEYDQRGVKVDDSLRTTNRQVFAAGDICFPYKFTHSADALARIVIANALLGARQKSSALIVPWCTYTDPEVAHVGLYEGEAKERGIPVTTITVPMEEVDRAVLDGEAQGFARIHLRKGSDRILGATIVSRHAGDMISEITLSMTSGLGLSAIGKTIHPYPTQSEALKKLADAYNRTRLTPLIKRVLDSWLRWQRR